MVERQIAIKVTVNDLLSGEYIQKEGWTPNFVRTTRGPVSRANIMGVIVQEPEPNVFVLDDGTGQVRVRTFENPVTNLKIGDSVLFVGRPRQYASQLFLNYEILKTINPAWLAYRKEELNHLLLEEQEVVKKQETVIAPGADEGEEVVVSTGENLFVKVLDVIRQLDTKNDGQGAEHDKILSLVDNKEAARVLTSLLEEGEVFENKPGLLKVLE
ncbi:hypothetical protein GOV10_04245 [Candidatus Woesearchaeota archaeon]|nr:hypothetical protein [Candidatus Woesearchaeota archaeon]